MKGNGTATRLAAARLRAALVLLPIAATTLVAGCASLGGTESSDTGTGAVTGPVHVLMAASLLPLSDDLAAAFELAHGGTEVMISGASSAALREQILAGAPADVFIPADPVHLEIVNDDIGLGGDPVTVARNSLVLAVPVGNPANITSLMDLARPELLVGLCAAEVPCGALARSGLAASGIEPAPDTEEPNVRALVTKLSEAELDTGVVYASDVSSADSGLESLGWPHGTAPKTFAPQTAYRAAVLTDAPNPAAAAAFVDFMASDTARTIFDRHGFEAP